MPEVIKEQNLHETGFKKKRLIKVWQIVKNSLGRFIFFLLKQCFPCLETLVSCISTDWDEKHSPGSREINRRCAPKRINQKAIELSYRCQREFCHSVPILFLTYSVIKINMTKIVWFLGKLLQFLFSQTTHTSTCFLPDEDSLLINSGTLERQVQSGIKKEVIRGGILEPQEGVILNVNAPISKLRKFCFVTFNFCSHLCYLSSFLINIFIHSPISTSLKGLCQFFKPSSYASK